ncbi:PSD1 and planctomycete cytochrome C domain-containing protein [Neorhodopirellula pilleata]|uniref:PSD1 and planctomycete cytochrome C domain-containing protein n=1 Tax=Neorhodopirellula pilleata TaxID=2714738 RepID=UPI0018CD8FDB|nr:PSD1 and planctomycete cytochrome C domain-containing protein [Neorhodopirellula pilleata]
MTLVSSASSQPTPTLANEVTRFSRDIQPLLAKHCIVCHGPDEAEAGLSLVDSSRATMKLDSGQQAIIQGQPENSELMRRVMSSDDSLRMPPDGERLSDQEIGHLARWIESGAAFETHWAYQPLTEPTLPATEKSSEWVRNPIDLFVLANLQHHGIEPSEHADRVTLIKRLSYDLVGLPPTPQQVDAFIADSSHDAYEELVDRLLASEAFGERWGRHWLDKARYADSDGYEKDKPRPNAWRYRDWVIDAINRDLPYDQFTIEQLAGDLLPEPSTDQRLATAFHRQTLTNTEGGVDQEEFRVEATFDRTETTGAIWMGLTMTCARCHTHKYDQITQREYFQLFAFFNSADEANMDVPRSEQALRQHAIDQAEYDRQVQELEQELENAIAEIQPKIDQWTAEMTDSIAAADRDPVSFATPSVLSATADSEAEFASQDDGSLLVTGSVADQDRYSLEFKLPERPLTGIRLEALTDETLAKKGPGRAPNGNFVVSQIRLFVSPDREFQDPVEVVFTAATSDFSQSKFPAEGALSADEKTGWAISPETGKQHQWIGFATVPLDASDHRYLRVVIDQSYGGQHTLGRFRLSTMSGFDPLANLPKEVAEALRVAPPERSAKNVKTIAYHVASIDPRISKLIQRLEKRKKQTPESPTMTVRVIRAADRKTKLLHRGDFLQPAEEVQSDVLEMISRTHPLRSRKTGHPADRLDLASWLVDPAHPLTSRVTVNHVWADLFGRGIVPTVNDFGVRGELPTHPQLLDWLAWQFSHDMMWSRKTLIKTIVMSATYQQASAHRDDLVQKDPTNDLFARQNRLRVSAEVIRDLHLDVSGLLSHKVGGPSVFPPLPPGVAELSYANNFKWTTSGGDDAYRRGMYTFFKRTSPHPTLISFDCPDSNTTRLQRETSNTPLQALVTLNNGVFTEAAQAMARRVLIEGGGDDRQRLRYALRLCIARHPQKSELDRFEQLLKTARQYYQSHPDDAARLASNHRYDQVNAEENAAWIATLRMVLNLDEFIVRD